jgi:hypothetical protein
VHFDLQATSDTALGNTLRPTPKARPLPPIPTVHACGTSTCQNSEAAMARSTRSVPGHLRQSSALGNPGAESSGQSAALLARINEKKAELDNLKELRDLSAAVASQMEALEQKLSTLSNGTEGAVSCACCNHGEDADISCLLSCSHRDCSWQLAQRSTSDQHGFEYDYCHCIMWHSSRLTKMFRQDTKAAQRRRRRISPSATDLGQNPDRTRACSASTSG